MGHYAAEIGYKTPKERSEEFKNNIDAARAEIKSNTIPDLEIGDDVAIAIKGYYYLYDACHKIFLEHIDRLINYVKIIKGIKILNIKKENGYTYVHLGNMDNTELWYDVQLFKKVI